MKKKFASLLDWLFRKKYLLTGLLFIVSTFFNWKGIPIQDNYVAIIKILMLAVGGGFTVKSAKDILMKKMEGNDD
jgi:hypothetical protein